MQKTHITCKKEKIDTFLEPFPNAHLGIGYAS